jgi:hypothetical protein
MVRFRAPLHWIQVGRDASQQTQGLGFIESEPGIYFLIITKEIRPHVGIVMENNCRIHASEKCR